MLIHAFNFFLLFFVARHFLYKPVTRFIDERAAKIRAANEEISKGQNQIAQARESQQSDYDACLAKGEVEANSRLLLADQDARRILDAAHEEAQRIKAASIAAAQEEIAKARSELREEIAELSIQLSSRILEREIKQQDHEALIDEFLEKVG